LSYYITNRVAHFKKEKVFETEPLNFPSTCLTFNEIFPVDKKYINFIFLAEAILYYIKSIVGNFPPGAKRGHV